MAQPPLAGRLDALLRQAMAEQRIPGLAAAVTRHGAVIYAEAFGVANRESGAPVTTESIFHLASVTKLFVATALVQLAEQGAVDLHAPVVRYLPYFRLADPRHREISLWQMLTHTSGMPDTEEYGWESPEYDDGALERYVRSLEPLTLLSAPGERFAYSNIAFEVLGDLIAKVSGMAFETYVRERILLPLGMSRSTLLVRETDPALLTRPHVLDDAGEIVVSSVFPYNRAHAPSSTLYSNVAELSRFALANLNRGALDGHRIVAPAAYDTMWQPYASTDDEDWWPEVGLTWFIGRRHGYRTVGHDGEDTGFTSVLTLVPEAGISVALLSNYDRTRIEALRDAVLDIVLMPAS
jgi:CubicO group peptidase (beta-lactamase class C family)